MPNCAHGQHKWCTYWKSYNLRPCFKYKISCHKTGLVLDFPLSSLKNNLYLLVLN